MLVGQTNKERSHLNNHHLSCNKAEMLNGHERNTLQEGLEIEFESRKSKKTFLEEFVMKTCADITTNENYKY